jgi:hypothetical protein
MHLIFLPKEYLYQDLHFLTFKHHVPTQQGHMNLLPFLITSLRRKILAIPVLCIDQKHDLVFFHLRCSRRIITRSLKTATAIQMNSGTE